MTFISTEYGASSPSPLAAIRAGLAGFAQGIRTYRKQRAIYLRTLRELESYRPHELHDLRVQSADFEELARKQAGW
jgi:uncharacterized protein YjiS (DUF1127 family)